MSDKMTPLPIETLFKLVMGEYRKQGTIFGISKSKFFNPSKNKNLAFMRYGKELESPLGVAAGPHTQLSQNIISAWLVGSRYIELKTVQTLDELHVSKPCIDMEDEGYNCEWSQELKTHESFLEYLNAWIMIHILKKELGLGDGEKIGTIFNMSVGYNMEGILKPNVQKFFSQMRDAGSELDFAKAKLRSLYPKIDELKIPSRISDNITLSTMHGCPPDEIEKIALYLINELGLHTTVKLNPTLNGAETLRLILNDKLGFKKTVVPDIAFEHDLKYPDAVKIIKNLQTAASAKGVSFSLKLTNTLESQNNKNNFDRTNEMMYMSGRALHALSVNLANKLQKDFKGTLDISFSAGVDAFNVSDILACDIKPVTVCSDLLKPGGYERMAQYFEKIQEAMKDHGANSVNELVFKKSGQQKKESAILETLDNYIARVLEDPRYKKEKFPWTTIKTKRVLNAFDCIKAPCVETCPTGQDVPSYMYFTAKGDFAKALEVIRYTNPLPNTTGMACDHICEDKCTRMNYDDTLLIRDIKRFNALLENEKVHLEPKRRLDDKVAIIGGGPAGLSAAFYLAYEGAQVEIFEAHELLGGMVTRALPDFRTAKERVNKDIERIKSLGVKIHSKHPINSKEKFNALREKYDYVFISCGASKSKRLGITGEESRGVMGFLEFLEAAKLKNLTSLPEKVVVIGGGNSSIDCVRTANRLTKAGGSAKLIYRRTIEEMPASREEIHELYTEEVKLLELVSPLEIISERGSVKEIKCIRMQKGAPDSSGRATVSPIKGSEFLVPADFVVISVGQEVDSVFEGLFRTQKNGTLLVNETMESSLENVFVGGDLVHGPKSIIQAVADGKKAAYAILTKMGISGERFGSPKKSISLSKIRGSKSHRVYGSPLPSLPLHGRKGFDLVVQTLSEENAKAEAARCLHCDEICDVCVSVCPNRANISYETEPHSYYLHDVAVASGNLLIGDKREILIKQSHQVMNIGDFCNECGNCATFCPTSGRPYTDKPKLYLFKESYDKEKENAYFFDSHKALLHFKHAGKSCTLKAMTTGWSLAGDFGMITFDSELKVNMAQGLRGTIEFKGESLVTAVNLYRASLR